MNWSEVLPEAVAEGAGWRPVTAVTADSRAVVPGTLFFALAGARADGHDYIGEAVAAGAVGVIAERPVAVPPDTDVAVHPEARRLLGEAAARLHGQPSRQLPVVAVTGTNGKTTVAWLLAGLFERGGVIGTLGWGRAGREQEAALQPASETTPDAVTLQDRLERMRRDGITGVAMEASSHGLDQHRLAGTELAGAVWTNLSAEHLDYHRDLAAYRAAKRRLVERPELGFAVINGEDPEAEHFAGAVAPGVALWRFGLEAGDVCADEIETRRDGIHLVAATPRGPVTVDSALVGAVNVPNLLAAVAVGLALGLDPATVGARLSAPPPVPGRMEDVGATPAGCRVWVDFAHTAEALERTLAGARELIAGRLWCVFGCGGERDTAKRAAMGGVAARLCDRVVLTSDNPRSEDPEAIIAAIAAGMPAGGALREPDRAAAIRRALEGAGAGDGVVIAGKGHEDYQEVAGERLPFSDREVVRQWLAPVGEAVGHDDPG
ncbi:MAG TPA: UDP-N-acetylmuramoyl-L-alanyl-D-glutamate--2,6-diaminopimelate ligase [Gammaproteobacteria bacterium]|nr:UDP-N-acetylmuramoyl-L-alanyl-D-glutamate--2,6-diaminopimelate ligase [Gammaproteobacteria bacterium]